MIWVDQNGEEKKYSLLDLANLSNQAANALLKYGINKGDRALVLLPRNTEWWIFAIALNKLGAVFAPCPTMLTPPPGHKVPGQCREILDDHHRSGKHR
ncbi:MAG: AMP-binding protein [Methanoregula sp.]|nr:AMP-binding protein [Methanoregula sp.]